MTHGIRFVTERILLYRLKLSTRLCWTAVLLCCINLLIKYVKQGIRNEHVWQC